MDKVIQNLKNMEKWIDSNLQRSANFETHYDFMSFAVEVMNRCLYLLKLGVYSVQDADPANTGYPQPKAIIVGHMVRLTKLYEGALIHISGCQVELARIFFRPILETAMKIEELIRVKGPVSSDFILSASYPEPEMLRETGYKTKDLPCPSSEWQDIRLHHLIQNGDCYVPNLSFIEPNPNVGRPLTQICLDALVIYLEWNKSDPHGVMTSAIAKLRELNASLDETHESWLGGKC